MGILFVLFFLSRGCKVYWVGSTDLEIEFVVTDAESGRPIPSAIVHVDSEGGLYDEREKQTFELTTDAVGVARKVCHDSMCFGTDRMWPHSSTYVVHLPWWHYRVHADGYEKTERVYLDSTEQVRQVRQVRPNLSKLVVPVSLQKKVTDPAMREK